MFFYSHFHFLWYLALFFEIFWRKPSFSLKWSCFLLSLVATRRMSEALSTVFSLDRYPWGDGRRRSSLYLGFEWTQLSRSVVLASDVGNRKKKFTCSIVGMIKRMWLFLFYLRRLQALLGHCPSPCSSKGTEFEGCEAGLRWLFLLWTGSCCLRRHLRERTAAVATSRRLPLTRIRGGHSASPASCERSRRVHSRRVRKKKLLITDVIVVGNDVKNCTSVGSQRPFFRHPTVVNIGHLVCPPKICRASVKNWSASVADTLNSTILSFALLTSSRFPISGTTSSMLANKMSMPKIVSFLGRFSITDNICGKRSRPINILCALALGLRYAMLTLDYRYKDVASSLSHPLRVQTPFLVSGMTLLGRVESAKISVL